MLEVKVCGIRSLGNLTFLKGSSVDYLGFIFYDKSSRNFADGEILSEEMRTVSKKKVGVFVDESENRILDINNEFGLDVVQLHGHESHEFCRSLKDKGITVFKAVSVKDHLPENLQLFEGNVDAFLFDTKGKMRGGNGEKFDWSCLSDYDLSVPYFLSGGIDLSDAEEILKLEFEMLKGVDVNSRFEIEPGLKDEKKLERFIKKLKHGYVGNEN